MSTRLGWLRIFPPITFSDGSFLSQICQGKFGPPEKPLEKRDVEELRGFFVPTTAFPQSLVGRGVEVIPILIGFPLGNEERKEKEKLAGELKLKFKLPGEVGDVPSLEVSKSRLDGAWMHLG